MPNRLMRSNTCLVAFVLSVSACSSGCWGSGGAGAARAPAPAMTDLAMPVDSFVVRFATSKGDVDVMLRTHWAPHGTARVHEAVSAGFYDGARFFRALRGFVAQFGIAADTAMTAAWRGRAIPDDTVRVSNRRGTLVFAAGGPNTRTTQLFFNLRDNPRLDAMGFAPLGEIVRGADAVDAFYTEYARTPGVREPDQGAIAREGETYLAREYPLLDRIVTARIVATWPAGR